jgi:putative oxidoreductase
LTVGQLALRSTIGPLFVGHGAQKLFGKFGGHGLEGTGGFFESIGLRPGKRHATAAGVAELAGGALLTAGALTPLAATAITGTMVTAIRKAHIANGPWVTQNGFEYNLVLIAAMAAITDTGPGKLSVDAARFPSFKGPALALLQLAAGVAGSYLATEVFNQAETGSQEGQADLPGDPATADGSERSDTGRFAAETSEQPTTPTI